MSAFAHDLLRNQASSDSLQVHEESLECLMEGDKCFGSTNQWMDGPEYSKVRLGYKSREP